MTQVGSPTHADDLVRRTQSTVFAGSRMHRSTALVFASLGYAGLIGIGGQSAIYNTAVNSNCGPSNLRDVQRRSCDSHGHALFPLHDTVTTGLTVCSCLFFGVFQSPLAGEHRMYCEQDVAAVCHSFAVSARPGTTGCERVAGAA